MISTGMQIDLEGFIKKVLGFKDDDLLRVKAAYDSPARHYHTFRHAMFVCAEAIMCHCTESFEYFPEVLVAGLYHDAICAPGVPKNEENSALLMREHLSKASRFNSLELGMIEHFIMLTAKHFQHEPGSLPRDSANFLDCDLVGLAYPWDTFLAQNDQIDLEYLDMGSPKDFLNEKRGEFLRGILERPHIYNSPRGIKEYEEKARKNIQRLVKVRYS